MIILCSQRIEVKKGMVGRGGNMKQKDKVKININSSWYMSAIGHIMPIIRQVLLVLILVDG